MHRKFLYIIATVFLVSSYKIEVRLKKGVIRGIRKATVFGGRLYYAFYEIPYAESPIGKLRFKNPTPVKKWEGIMDGTSDYHGACAQAHIVHKHALFGVEDCLHLNIFTPRLPKSEEDIRPVIVWYHGYAFTSSFSHIFGPDFMIVHNVLFVSVTYRIGALGFLKNNATDVNANMGLKDMVMSLKWIKRNIARFGGDPSKVTVMGSSSAANMLSLLLTTKARKLLSKMILHSGALYSPSVFQSDPLEESMRLKQELDKKGLKNIKNASVKDIVLSSNKIYTNKEVINSQRPIVPFTPYVEVKSNESLITSTPENMNKIKKGFINIDIPILIGFNTQESLTEVAPFIHNPMMLKMFDSFFKFMVPFSDGCSYNYSSKIYKDISITIKQHYFKDGISEKSINDFLKYTTDLRRYPIYKFIKSQLAIKTKLFVYKFNYNGKFNTMKSNSLANLNTKVKGAASGDELCYLMKCEPLWETYTSLNNETVNTRDKLFIEDMAEMWTNFAKTGDPTPPSYSGDLKWPPMTLEDDSILFLSKIKKIVDSRVEEKMFDFWNSIYDKFYKAINCENSNFKLAKDEL